METNHVRAVSRLTLFGLLSLAGLSGSPTSAAEAPPAGTPPARSWAETAELSYVVTGGNAETSTLGFKNSFTKKWDGSNFELKTGAVRASSTTTRFALGPSDTDFDVVKETDLTAESYDLNGRYDRNIGDHAYWFAGAGWERNRFAGVENRASAAAGLGNRWADQDRLKYRTDYAVTYTKQDDVTEPPGFEATYAGFRLTSNLFLKLGPNGSYGNDTLVDENLKETTDLRVNMSNWVAVSMSNHLALKVNLQLLYDHQPAVRELDRVTALGGPVVSKVLIDLDTLTRSSLRPWWSISRSPCSFSLAIPGTAPWRHSTGGGPFT